jgi:Ca-activated chloride channel family protein
MIALHFAEPQWLPLLVAPAALLCAWMWRYAKRRRDAARIARRRHVPGAARIPASGDLLLWLCLLLATACTILAIARPQIVQSRARTAGIDLVVLQDGSASMRVGDVREDRWQRSMAFLRALGESLRWEEDRVALTLFAHIATPQIRLTRDPNTFFFFLDHLHAEPPFRLEDEGTWDTNIERAVHWGLRLIEKDEEIAGPSRNVRAFVLLSDGQAWSGEIARSLALARARDIPLHVIGVGTTAGGVIPQSQRGPVSVARLSSTLDRNSLAAIASAGGGRYFELDRDKDGDIANTIIDLTRRRAAGTQVEEGMSDLYWEALLIAAGFALAGTLLQRDRTALVLQALVAGTLLAWLR